MKTILAVTTTMGPQWRYYKTIKFINYYKKHWDIIALDNGSPKEKVESLIKETGCKVKHFEEYFDRPSENDYLYLWRALYYVKELHNEYDKVILMDNDFFALSPKIIEYINAIDTGWVSFWLERHKLPETSCQIIMKNEKTYNDFVASGNFKEHNLKHYETTIPVTYIAKQFIGDRYIELGENAIPKPPFKDIDFIAQTRLEDSIE